MPFSYIISHPKLCVIRFYPDSARASDAKLPHWALGRMKVWVSRPKCPAPLLLSAPPLRTAALTQRQWAPAKSSAPRAFSSPVERKQTRKSLSRPCSRWSAPSLSTPGPASISPALRSSQPGGRVLPSAALWPHVPNTRYFVQLPSCVPEPRITSRYVGNYTRYLSRFWDYSVFPLVHPPAFFLYAPARNFAHRQPKSFELVATSVGYGQGRGEAW